MLDILTLENTSGFCISENDNEKLSLVASLFWGARGLFCWCACYVKGIKAFVRYLARIGARKEVNVYRYQQNEK